MSDLVYLLNTLLDCNGEILIPGIHDDVEPLTKDELQIYEEINFDVKEFKNFIGCNKLRHQEDKVSFFYN